MQAPNKVYILPSQHNLQYDNGGEEYIRKDALLEWAKEHQEGEYVGSYTWACYQIFIDKLESL